MHRHRRLLMPALAFAAAALAGTIAYFLFDTPDEVSVQLRIQEQVAQRIGAEMVTLEGMSYQFIANQDLNDALYAYGRRANRYDVALYNLSFTRQLESQSVAPSLLEEAFFLDWDEADRIPLTMTEDILRPEIAEVRRFVWERAIEADGACVWMDGTLVVHRERYILAARLIKKLKTGEPIGVLVLLVNSSRAAELAERSLAGSDTLPRGNVLLVAPSLEILAASDPSLAGGPVSSAIGMSSAFGTAVAEGLGSGSFFAEQGGRRAAAVFTRIGTGGPYLLALYPDRTGFTPYRRISTAAFFALAAAAAAVFGARRRRTGAQGFSGVNAAGETGAVRSVPVGGDGDEFPPDLPPLSARERQLLQLLAKGLSNKEIASELGIKEQTVKNYLKPLYDKLGVHDRVSALLRLRSFRAGGSPDGST